jgi:hypothetical protein
MTAIAIVAVADSLIATPDEPNKEEDVLIIGRTEEMFHTKIRLMVWDSIKIST